MALQTPILFLIFNRPDTTIRVFEKIAQQQPLKLYVAADGPRINKTGEENLCLETRTIIEKINWPCKVKKLYRKENLGCKMAVSNAISWFFEQETEGIILEDDCLPNDSFFGFCEQMLNRYRHNERIMHIGGTNFQFGNKIGNGDYYYSNYNHIWGWATWQRAWKNYDVTIGKWPAFKKNNYLKNILKSKLETKNWTKIFDDVFNGKVNTWDYQWTFTMWCNGGLAVIPSCNLVQNIGFGSDQATHKSNKNNTLANMKVFALNRYHAPDFMVAEKDADTKSMINYFMQSKLRYLINKLISIIK